MAVIGGIKDDYGATLQFDDGTSRYLLGPEAQSIADQFAPQVITVPGNGYAPTTGPDITAPEYWQKPLAPPDVGPAPAPPTGRLAGNGDMSAEPNMSVDPGPQLQAQPAPAPAPQGPDLSFGPGGNEAAMAAYKEARQGRAVYTPAYDPEKDNASRKEVRQGITTQVSGQTPFSEDVMTAPDRLRRVEENALMARNDAAYKAATEDQMIAQQQYNAAQIAQKREEERLAQIDAQLSDARWKYNQIEKQIGEGKINPNRLMQGPGGLLAAVGVALGEFGRAIAGTGTNTAAQIVQQAIDRDVAAQEKEFSLKRDRANNMFRDMMQVYGDRNVAREALKAAQARAAVTESGVILAGRGRTQANADLAEGVAQLQRNYEQRKAELEKAMLGSVTTAVNSAYVAPRAASVQYVGGKSAGAAAEEGTKVGNFYSSVGGGGTQEQRFTLAKEGAKQTAETEAGDRQRVVIENGQPLGYAVGKDSKEVQVALDAQTKGMQAAAEYQSLLKNYPIQRMVPGGVPLAGAPAARMRALATDLLLGIKQAEQMGALDAGAVRIAEGKIPQPNDPNASTKIQELVRTYEQARQNILRNHVSTDPRGFTPALPPAPPPVRGAQDIK